MSISINGIPNDFCASGETYLTRLPDIVWEQAKLGHYDGQNILKLVGDVLLCFGDASLPKTMELPSTLRFATNKTVLDNTFSGNTYVKDLTVWCQKQITSSRNFIAWSKIQTVNFRAEKGATGTNTGDIGGFAHCFINGSSVKNITFDLGSSASTNGMIRCFNSCSALTDLKIISDVPNTLQDVNGLVNGCSSLKNFTIQDNIIPSTVNPCYSDNFIKNSPLTIESIKNITKFYLRSTIGTNAFNQGAFMSVGKVSNISSGNLTTDKHLDNSGVETEQQWSTTYNNITYYANNDLWTCFDLLYSSDTLELDGVQYTGMNFKNHWAGTFFYFV